MFRRPIKEIGAEYPAEERYLPDLQRSVSEACAVSGMPRKDISAVKLAIEEAATNIIRHAYLYESGSIRLRIVIYQKFIVFSLIDSGRSFNPDKQGQLDLRRLVDSGRKGGLGFYMIQKIMDSVEYISSSGLNELRMTRRIKRSSSASRPLLRRLMSLRVRFSVGTFAVVMIILGGSLYFVDQRTTRLLHAELNQTVKALATTIADQSAGYLINNRSDVEFDDLIVSFGRANPVLLQVVLVDSAGIVLAHSSDIHKIRKPFEFPVAAHGLQYGEVIQNTAAGADANYVIEPINLGDTRLGQVHITFSTAGLASDIADARRGAMLFTFLLVLVGIVGIYMLSNYFVRPIARITRRVRSYASGDLESELPLEGAEEFFEISKAFNEMTTRLNRDREAVVARETMAKEIELASQIQRTLMPASLPKLPGLALHAYYRAASIVGGDLYDVIDLGKDRYCLVVADVSGKGVPASLVMSMLRTVIQIFSRKCKTARQTLVQVNDHLCANIPSGMFVTILLAFYDCGKNSIEIVSAGHNPLLLLRRESENVERINPKGMPLGMPTTLGKSFEDSLEEVKLKLRPGDLFFIYTDGVTEAADPEGKFYGLERLEELLKSNSNGGQPPELEQLSQKVVLEVDRYCGYAKPEDDITFIIARSDVDIGIKAGVNPSDGEKQAAVKTRRLKSA